MIRGVSSAWEKEQLAFVFSFYYYANHAFVGRHNISCECAGVITTTSSSKISLGSTLSDASLGFELRVDERCSSFLNGGNSGCCAVCLLVGEIALEEELHLVHIETHCCDPIKQVSMKL